MRRARYEPHGLLALEPRAFGAWFDLPDAPAIETRSGVALVTIRGPLLHHDESYWWDSYEGIVTRVADALESAPRAVLLCVDSPGGLVSGCFDAARTLRALARTAGIPLIAFVDGTACSGAYALACGADRVFASETALVGSIGVIEEIVDATAANERIGLKVALVTSGARKADGHPDGALSDSAIAAAQSRVNELAAAFFALVSEMRGVPIERVRALEAGVVLGAEAVRSGLADELATFDRVLAIASGEGDMTTKGAKASTDYDDAIATLRKIASEGGDEEADKAKKMLATLADEKDDGEPEPKSEEGKGNADEDDDEGTEEEKPDKKEDAPSASTPLRLAARIQALEAEAAARVETDRVRAEDEARSKLLATRPDFASEAIEVLRSAPLAVVKNAVEKWPRGPVRLPHNPAAATAVLGATRGETQNDDGPTSDATDLDVAMGLARPKQPIRHEGTRMVLGVMTPGDARAYEAAQKPTAPAR